MRRQHVVNRETYRLNLSWIKDCLLDPTWDGKYSWRLSGQRWRLNGLWDGSHTLYLTGDHLVFRFYPKTINSDEQRVTWIYPVEPPALGQLLEAIIFSREETK